MSSFLHRLHADLRNARLTRRGATHAAHKVVRDQHKTYPRLPQHVLPEPEPLTATLAETLSGRRSATGGDPGIPFSSQEFSTLLGLSLRKRSDGRGRNYPSGGALYPIETYLIVTAADAMHPGAYHYEPTRHALELLCHLPSAFDIKTLAKQPPELPVSALIVFTSIWQRSSAKYGELAYQHALLEAGHMSENMLLVAAAMHIQARPYAGFSDTLIAQLLDLDETREQTVHTITLCKGSSAIEDFADE